MIHNIPKESLQSKKANNFLFILRGVHFIFVEEELFKSRKN